MNNFLKRIREERNIGQSELAEKVGVSKQLLSGFENGRSGISNEVLKKISDFLQVSTDTILNGKSSIPFDNKSRNQLSEAMRLTFKFYGDEFDKETIIKIATELYGLMVDFENLKVNSKKEHFKKILEEKIAQGLAAKCFLGYFNKY
jgi:transcriptional regulator with XRE-family HTH domain